MDSAPQKSPGVWLDALIVACAFVVMLAWAWDKGPDPIVDFGRECYVPWRISEGDVLYLDIHYFNGPLSPHLNALAYELLGTSLRTLKIVNAFVIALSTMLIWWLIREISDRVAATTAAVVFLTLFAFPRLLGVANYNWLTPYSHELTHGITLSLAAIATFIRFQRSTRTRGLIATGVLLGAIFLTKPEVFLAAALAISFGIIAMRRNLLGSAVIVLASSLAPVVIAFLLLLMQFSARDSGAAIAGSWAFMFDPALTGLPYFQRLRGTLDILHSLREIGMMTLFWIIIFAPGAIFARFIPARFAIVPAVLIGALLWSIRFRIAWEAIALPIPLLCIGVIAWSLRRRRMGVLVFAIFALTLTIKIHFNVKIGHYGFALALPGATLFVAAVVGWLPRGKNAPVTTLWSLAVLLVVVIFHLWMTSLWFSRETETIADGTTDEFRIEPRGLPMQMLVRIFQQISKPDESLVMIPDGLIANYLARRVNPTGYLNFTPPALIMYGESNMLAAFEKHPPHYIAIVNDDSREYGAPFLGIDYGQMLMRWIEQNYSRVKVYGAAIEEPEKIGGITLLRRVKQTNPPER